MSMVHKIPNFECFECRFGGTKRLIVRWGISQWRLTTGDAWWRHQTVNWILPASLTTLWWVTLLIARLATNGGMNINQTRSDSQWVQIQSSWRKGWTMCTDITRPTGPKCSNIIKSRNLLKIPYVWWKIRESSALPPYEMWPFLKTCDMNATYNNNPLQQQLN